jgi:hypothetical protein
MKHQAGKPPIGGSPKEDEVIIAAKPPIGG